MENTDRIIAITYDDFLKYGCANCGCDVILQRDSFGGIGTCEECGKKQMIFSAGRTKSRIGFRDDKTGVTYYPEVQEHPRKGIPWHPYIWPDPKPENGGEYWTSRGIGYDLSGFVKSKKAGERLLQMVKDVLGVENPKSWLDWRPHEPVWIQFKFQKEEFDLEKLNRMSHENNNILTLDILKACKI